MRAFETLHPADGLRFEIRSEIPLARGLGSSAAAIVAGLVAADHMFELGLGLDELHSRAAEVEGHPDNVAAALYGGFVLCPQAPSGEPAPAPVRLEPPEGVEAVLVIPDDTVPTADARAAMPAAVALDDAVANVAAAAQLVLGIERSDLALIAAGSRTAFTSRARGGSTSARCSCSPKARELGAIGATISGAGPTLLLWSFWQDTGKVVDAARAATEGWAEVRRVPFSPLGADVVEL